MQDRGYTMAAGPLRIHVIDREMFSARAEMRMWDDPVGLLDIGDRQRSAMLASPFSAGPRTPMRLVAEQAGRVVGKGEFLPGRIWIGKQPHAVNWAAGLVVDPAYRGQGIATALDRKRRAISQVFGACGASVAHARIYRRLGFHEVSRQRYVRPCRARPVVRRYLGDHPAAKVLTPLAEAALATGRRAVAMLAPPRPRGLTLQPAGALPADLEPIVNGPSAFIRTDRSCPWFEWVLTHQFHPDPGNRQALHLVVEPDRQPVAWMLTRVRFHERASHRGFPDTLLGSVGDWGILEPRRLTWMGLLQLACDVLEGCGCDAIECCLPPGHRTRGLMRRLGFVPLGKLYGFMHFALGLGVDVGAHPPRTWAIRAADGDHFVS